jgi:hypothetical protein
LISRRELSIPVELDSAVEVLWNGAGLSVSGTTHLRLSDRDAISRRSCFRLPRGRTTQIKMALMCELRAPVAKRLKITIKRKIPITAATGDDR